MYCSVYFYGEKELGKRPYREMLWMWIDIKTSPELTTYLYIHVVSTQKQKHTYNICMCIRIYIDETDSTYLSQPIHIDREIYVCVCRGMHYDYLPFFLAEGGAFLLGAFFDAFFLSALAREESAVVLGAEDEARSCCDREGGGGRGKGGFWDLRSRYTKASVGTSCSSRVLHASSSSPRWTRIISLISTPRRLSINLSNSSTRSPDHISKSWRWEDQISQEKHKKTETGMGSNGG